MKLTPTLTLPPEIFKFHWAALGITGSGKSYTIKWFVEQLLDAQQRVCIVDPKGDWWGLKSSGDGKSAGYPLVIFGGEHADVPIDQTSGAVVGELVATGNRPCIIDLKHFSEAAKCTFMIGFLFEIFRRNKARLMLVLDEAHEFAPQHPMRDEIMLLHWTNKLLSQGRSLGVQVVLSSQRPAKVHKDSLTQTQVLFALRVISVQDRKAVEAWVAGVGDTKQAKSVTDSLARLPVGEGWLYAPGSEILERVKFPRIKTYDSSATPEHAEFKMPKGWASVNLDELSAKMVQVKTEVDANDPKKLRAEIAALKKQLATPATVAKVDNSELAKAQGQITSLRSILREATDKITDVRVSVRSEINRSISDIESMIDRVVLTLKQPVIVTTTKPAPIIARAATPKPPHVAADRGGNRASAAGTSEGGLNAAQQRILDALAWLRSIDIMRALVSQVALLAGMNYGGGYFNNTLGSLSTRGLVLRHNGTIELTAGGEALAAHPRRALSLAEYHAQVRSVIDKLKGGLTVRILDALVEHGPREITIGAVAELVGASVDGGYFNNSIGPLGTLGLIRRERGVVRPTEILFPPQLS